jgi:hypothetical protein
MPKERKARWQINESHSAPVSGRSHLPTANAIFDRVVSLEMPEAGEPWPRYSTDTVPKDMFFPADEHEIDQALKALPAIDTDGISHIWLRRAKASEFRSGRIPLAEYIAWGDIALIVFYPWPESLRMPLIKKPADKVLIRYKRWKPVAKSHKAKWHFEWQAETAKDFCLNELVRHMALVHSDFRKEHSAREKRRGEEIPVQYANQRYFEENTVIRDGLDRQQ